MRSVRTLMDSIVDYAGLFPPAGLGMREAVRTYARHRSERDAWMLGRFVTPVSRLAEFEREAADLLPTTHDDEPWRISALTAPAGDPALEADIERVFQFNERWCPDVDEGVIDDASKAPVQRAVIDCLEMKAEDSRKIDAAISILPEGLSVFFEISPAGDPRGLVAALAGEPGIGAKIRTGGVTAEAFPPPEQVARFLTVCAAGGAPFKATAGLHHPVRGAYPLTYEPGCASGTMYGFLNVFLAAAFVYVDRMKESDARLLLEEADRDAFEFNESGVSWRGRRLDNDRLARARESFALSFGSCSFEEPLRDLRTLGLLLT